MENKTLCAERIKKQTYLKEEILNKGYDPQEFQTFLENRKINGGNNIDLWDFTELEKLVTIFHSQKSQIFKTDDLEIINLNSDLESPVIRKHESKISSNSKYKNPIFSVKKDSERERLLDELRNKDYEFILPCKPLQNSILSYLKPKEIEIIDCKIEDEGLFRFPYGNYTIKVIPLGFEVQRKMKDFVWLSENLKKLYPCNLIPPLPKKLYLKNLEKFYLNKRQKKLEMFLKEIIKDPTLKNTDVFLDFLSKTTGNLIELQSENYMKEDLQALRTPSGEIILKINPDLEIFHVKSAKYLIENKENFRKLNSLSTQLVLDFDQVTSTLFAIGDIFAEIHQSTLDYSNGLNNDLFREFNDIYVNLNNFAINWGNLISKQMQNVQQNLGFFFKQESRIQNQLIDLINARFGTSEDFYQTRIKLDLESASNEKIENLVKLKRTFAYFNQNVHDEIIRIFKNQFDKFSENFGRLAQNESVSIMEFHVIIADLLSNFDENQVCNRKALTIMRSNCNSRRSSMKSSIGEEENKIDN